LSSLRSKQVGAGRFGAAGSSVEHAEIFVHHAGWRYANWRSAPWSRVEVASLGNLLAVYFLDHVATWSRDCSHRNIVDIEMTTQYHVLQLQFVGQRRR